MRTCQWSVTFFLLVPQITTLDRKLSLRAKSILLTHLTYCQRKTQNFPTLSTDTFKPKISPPSLRHEFFKNLHKTLKFIPYFQLITQWRITPFPNCEKLLMSRWQTSKLPFPMIRQITNSPCASPSNLRFKIYVEPSQEPPPKQCTVFPSFVSIQFHLVRMISIFLLRTTPRPHHWYSGFLLRFQPSRYFQWRRRGGGEGLENSYANIDANIIAGESDIARSQHT